MKEQTNKGDTMKFAYVINTQNLEEYGENFHKFKGGSTYVVHGTISKEIFEKDAYGPGEHDYYQVQYEILKSKNTYDNIHKSVKRLVITFTCK